MALKWYGEQFQAAVQADLAQKFRDCGLTLKSHIQDKLGTAQPTAGTGLKKRGLDPSKPGEYPKKVRGHLRKNIASEVVKKPVLTMRVGTNVPYGLWLETGTRNMAPRPWLSRAYSECLVQLQAILGVPIAGDIK